MIINIFGKIFGIVIAVKIIDVIRVFWAIGCDFRNEFAFYC